MGLHITLFGRFSALREGKPLDGCESQKVQELFAYLLLNRERSHPREKLASVLWDYGTTERSRAYLRRLLWQLYHALEDHDNPSGEPVLLIESDWIQINTNANFLLDVALFEAAYTQSRGVPGQHIDQGCAQALEQAVQLYTSDLLENWYQDWCLFERERLKNAYLIMLDKLVDHCTWNQKYEQGLQYGERILYLDRAREHTHRQIMHLFYLAGKRTDALRQYERCAIALREELNLEPSKRTADLHEQIYRDQVEEVAANFMSASTLEGSSIPHGQLDRIRELRQILTTLQMHVHRDLEIIEHALHNSGRKK